MVTTSFAPVLALPASMLGVEGAVVAPLALPLGAGFRQSGVSAAGAAYQRTALPFASQTHRGPLVGARERAGIGAPGVQSRGRPV